MAPPLHKAIQDPQAFADACRQYVQSCIVKNDAGKDSDLIAIAGLAIALGVNREMISRWKERYEEVTEHDPERLIHHAIKDVETCGELQLQRMCVLGKNSMALAMGKIKHKWIEAALIKVDAKVSGSIAVVTGVSKPTSDDA